jgi:hypothetical protein
MVEKEKYIQKFKELHKLKTGNDLTDQEALSHFENLIALTQATYQLIPNTAVNQQYG